MRAYKTVSKKKVYGAVSSSIKTGPVLKAPSTFVLKGVTSSSLTLSWSAVDGAKGYEVLRSTDGKKWSTTDTKTKRSLTVKKLKAGTKYYFVVRAYSGKYDGTKSATRTFYTTPAAPSGLKLTKATTTSLAVSWGKVTGAAGYQVQYSTDGKKWTSLSGTTKTSATINSLSSGKKYYVRVRAYVKNSNVKDISATSYGGYSSTLTTYTNVVAPKTVSLTDVTTSSLTISWSSSTGAASYEYYNPVSKKWVSTKTSRSAKITGLNAGTKYSVKVKAIGSNKVAAETSTYYFVTTPAAPSNLSNSTAIGDVIILNSTTDSITVSWNKVSSAAAYQVKYSKDNGESWISAPETTSTTVTIKNLNADTAYIVKVRAYAKNSNVATYGDYSTVNARTLKETTPKTTVTTASESEKSIRVNWDEISGAKGYVVERYYGSSKEWKVFDFHTNNWIFYEEADSDTVILTTESAFIDSKGGSSRSDLYRVRIVDADGYLYYPSEFTRGETSDISVTVGDYATEVEFIGNPGATKIYVQMLSPGISNRIHTIKAEDYEYSDGKYKVRLTFAPDTIQYFSLVAEGISKALLINVKTNPLGAPITNTSDPNYNASVSSQLLYLAQAINNTKAYTNPISSKLTTSITTKCGDIEVYHNGKQSLALEGLFKLLAGDELAKDMQETQNYNYTFTNGKTKDENNVTVTLKSFIEPNNNSYKDAFLYNGASPSAWKDRITNFSSSLSGGKLTVSFEIKKESDHPVYHNGFLSALNSSVLNSKEFSTESVVVGESTIKAKVASDYILESYAGTAPFTGKFSMSMIVDKDTSQGGATVNKGDTLVMKIPISGSSTFNYAFTR